MMNTITNNAIGFNNAFPAFQAAERLKANGQQQIEFAETILSVMRESEKAEMTATDIQTALVAKLGKPICDDSIPPEERRKNSLSIQRISAFLGKLQIMSLVQKRVVKTDEMLTVKTRNGEKEIEKTISLFSLVG